MSARSGSSKAPASEAPAAKARQMASARLIKRSSGGRSARLRRSKLGVAGAIRLQLSFHPISDKPLPYRLSSTRSLYKSRCPQAHAHCLYHILTASCVSNSSKLIQIERRLPGHVLCLDHRCKSSCTKRQTASFLGMNCPRSVMMMLGLVVPRQVS
jgi:hypothetical protein